MGFKNDLPYILAYKPTADPLHGTDIIGLKIKSLKDLHRLNKLKFKRLKKIVEFIEKRFVLKFF
jgi:hypothetical protein